MSAPQMISTAPTKGAMISGAGIPIVSFPIFRLCFRWRRRGKLRNVDQAEHTPDIADLPLKKNNKRYRQWPRHSLWGD